MNTASIHRQGEQAMNASSIHTKGDKSMKEQILAIVDNLLVGDGHTFLNMTVFPLIGAVDGGLRYVPLDQALKEGVVDITEISEGGSVPDLFVQNRSGTKVLIIDGEEVVGAKQNRVLNTTILVGENTRVKVPVSCVEQGRWRYRSQKFSSSGNVYYSSGRAQSSREVSRSYEARGEARSDQRRVWREIEEKSMRLDSASETGALTEAYERRRGDLEEYQSAFTAVKGQVGYVVVVEGRICGVDIFGTEEVFGKLFRKLLTGYAMDAVDPRWRAEGTVAKEDARRFLATLKEAQFEEYPSPGVGSDLRIRSQNVTGHALVAEGSIVHMAVFPV